MITTEQRVNRRWEKVGFDALLPEEKGYVASWLLVMDVNNGGFRQYLTNNTSDVALTALEALHRAGADETRAILADALSILNVVGGYCADRSERWGRVDALPHEGAEFDALDTRFYNRNEEPLTLILARLEELYATQDVGA